jgi:tetratricopeptide (TPR) repeat protein
LALPCASCGFSNEPEEKFCGGCGTPLTAAPPPPAPPARAPQSYTPGYLAEKILTAKSALAGERKQVTVLFADLKGSMELLAYRDPEEARHLLDPVLERLMAAVHRYEGTVNQVLGDGIMALFGAPLAHEDHAVRACYAALTMQEALLLVGRVDEARTLAGRLLESAPTFIGRGYQAHASRLLGEAAACDDPPEAEQAETHYRQALALAEELGMRPLQTHCHLGLGTLYATTGQHEQARAALSAAIELYRGMEMQFWLPQAEAALAQVR